MHNEYEILDSGNRRKLERFADVTLSRPCEQAAWPQARPELWEQATATYDRDGGWRAVSGELPTDWRCAIDGITMSLSLTPAGHVGVFPETRGLWARITSGLHGVSDRTPNVLNLFAYSGGATLAAARAGSSVCHVDASKSMVTRARANASLNGLEDAPIRWIVDDVGKFLDREIRRGRHYDAIMLDPPSYGHGAKGETYRFDKDLLGTLEQCRQLLSDNPLFVLLTAHTRGTTPAHLESAIADFAHGGATGSGEMRLTGGAGVREVPDGVWAMWSAERR